jgi:hypothetical protein
MTAAKRQRGRPRKVEELRAADREREAADWLAHCERQLEQARRDAPAEAVTRSLQHVVRHVLWAHFEVLARDRNAWPNVSPHEARLDIEMGECSVMDHVSDVARILHGSGLHASRDATDSQKGGGS